ESSRHSPPSPEIVLGRGLEVPVDAPRGRADPERFGHGRYSREEDVRLGTVQESQKGGRRERRSDDQSVPDRAHPPVRTARDPNLGREYERRDPPALDGPEDLSLDRPQPGLPPPTPVRRPVVPEPDQPPRRANGDGPPGHERSRTVGHRGRRTR